LASGARPFEFLEFRLLIFLQRRTVRQWPTLEEVRAAWERVTESARAKLRGENVNEAQGGQGHHREVGRGGGRGPKEGPYGLAAPPLLSLCSCGGIALGMWNASC
jgi:hypothetical protein